MLTYKQALTWTMVSEQQIRACKSIDTATLNMVFNRDAELLAAIYAKPKFEVEQELEQY